MLSLPLKFDAEGVGWGKGCRGNDHETRRKRESDLFITSMIAFGRHEVLLPIIHKTYDFREKKNSQVRERENLHQKTDNAEEV